MVTSSIILQATQSLSTENSLPFIGFTTTKKIGSAVVRNRARRRLRAVSRELFPKFAFNNIEYVLIGRHNTATADYKTLQRDLKYALITAHNEFSKNDQAK